MTCDTSKKAEAMCDAFGKYIGFMARHLAGLDISPQTIDRILTECKQRKRQNERYAYLLHTIWLIGDDYITEAYERAKLEGYMRSAVRLLDLMPYRLEYNDYELIDFIRFKNEQIGLHRFRIPYRRLVSLDKEIMKFIFQFIIRFKKDHNIAIRY